MERRPRLRMFFAEAATVVIVLLLLLSLTLFVRHDLPPSPQGPDNLLVPPDPVAEFVQKNMVPASAAFLAQTPQSRNEPSEAVLEIAPPTISPLQLQAELRAAARRRGVTAGESIQIAPRMIANLTADRPCTIAAKDPIDRAIRPGQRAKWRWTVTPLVGGPLDLTATLTAPVIIDGKETGYFVTSFEKTVTVDVTYRQRAGDVLQWSKDYWAILGAAGGALLALWAWMRRKERPARPGF